jgi:hypothetical protein
LTTKRNVTLVVGVACIVRVHPEARPPLRIAAAAADGDGAHASDGDGSTTARRERNRP